MISASMKPSSSKRKLNQKPEKKQLIYLEDEDSEDSDIPLSLLRRNRREACDYGSTLNTLSSSMKQAKELQAKLSPATPSFVKLMLKSHVSNGFWLRMPPIFCRQHLTGQDQTVVLVNESGKEYKARFLADRVALSGGWKGFSTANKLVQGDVVVFQLVAPHKFKVHILRAGGLPEGGDHDEDDDAVILVDHAAAEMKATPSSKPASKPCPRLKKMKGIKDSTPNRSHHVYERRLPSNLQSKYRELCRSQKVPLHENIIPGISTELVAGVIHETTAIAEAIQALKPGADCRHLERWDRVLRGFADWGMVVGFMQSRVHRLQELSCLHRDAVLESKVLEREQAKEELSLLVKRVEETEELVKNLDLEIAEREDMQRRRVGFVFEAVASAPW